MNSNSIQILNTYNFHGSWVFDDEATGLYREAFVAGIDTMIDTMVEDIPDAKSGFRLLFSTSPFPGHQLKLDLVSTEAGGSWYYCQSLGYKGWLCPALFRYFSSAPATLFAQALPRK